MSDHILVPYDGSEPAESALEYAFENFSDADVTALYVLSVPEGYWGAFEGADDEISDEARKRGESVLEEATAVAKEHDIDDFETELASGTPDHEIVARVEEEAYDTVVIGSHGREGVSRILLGSVAENVVRRAPVPVMVVR
ncbi:universal stress protein [Natronolimnohabitans sp. A-GB9]|uniref:universal stress protein n=1 Tax=Natronolimnohabitans sp. A-GB9 TaxID=3069757 RepID=UPI0027B24100|nr:universal stress protein [Natronolimnohabitans sp. A-GB9]MDQ2052431.1 universal stress protein [Natronolimnohabitans sp. A-GB9]